jgi:hypothetical protein
VYVFTKITDKLVFNKSNTPDRYAPADFFDENAGFQSEINYIVSAIIMI